MLSPNAVGGGQGRLWEDGNCEEVMQNLSPGVVGEPFREQWEGVASSEGAGWVQVFPTVSS